MTMYCWQKKEEYPKQSYFASEEPWILAKDPMKFPRFKQVIRTTLESLRLIATALYPLMPKTAESILTSVALSTDNILADFKPENLSSGSVLITQPLFPFIEAR